MILIYYRKGKKSREVLGFSMISTIQEETPTLVLIFVKALHKKKDNPTLGLPLLYSDDLYL